MAGLDDPSEGKVLLNGRDNPSYTPEERARKVGFIRQDPCLFSGTVRDPDTGLEFTEPGMNVDAVRGKPISEVAANNAKAVGKRIETEQGIQDKVARLNLQGVSALNRNDAQAARGFFEQAYKLDPRNAFTLNNMGYVAEMDGDHETADQFYASARAARDASARVTLANRHEMQGLPLGQVARSNDEGAQANLEATREARRREGGPIQLKRRDNTPVTEPESTPSQQNQVPPAAAPQNQLPQDQAPQVEPPPNSPPQR